MAEDIGPALRVARKRAGLSLRELAARTGVSASLLSQVENGHTRLSVNTLYAVVSELDLSIDELLGRPTAPAPHLQAEDRTAVVHRKGERPVLEMENGVTWERLAPLLGESVDSLLATYQPGGTSSANGRLMRHNGIEYAYLLSGELELQLEFDTHVLKAGDSLCFDSATPHLYANRGSVPASGVWFIVGRQVIARDESDLAREIAEMLRTRNAPMPPGPPMGFPESR
ncbi:helix-turn-helix domain-containing protein [Streptomyces sp. NPDC055692]|uniref:helix-turn-helix domain-containing protein n=1 Tax=Streptomyces sp. NPDC055692 TaxID=3155683 RepID=UPI003443AA27